MDRVQQNGGTAGYIAALCLALLFIFFISSGLDPQTMQDPAKALSVIGQKSGLIGGIGILGLLASGFGLVFTIGLFARLREKAPTRAAASLGFAFVGLTLHALGSTLVWQGGQMLVALSGKDATAAGHAWAALGSVNQGVMATANAFTGAAIFVAGWAIIETGVMNKALGWLAVAAGIVQVLGVFSTQMALMGLGIVLAIIWLAWGGAQLRQSPA